MLWPQDVYAILRMKFFRTQLYKRSYENAQIERCWELLKLTSRTFAAVIEELHPELRNAMMIFYLVLRGLDTIEDDTGLDPKVKLPLLRRFKQEVLTSKTWTFHESSPTEKDRVVLQEFDTILRIFHELRPEYQDIIADITQKMGNGMADFVAAEASGKNYDGVPTVKDYDLYCHYVAGVVGEGITRMALVAKFATPQLAEKPELFESMGLFLQKTNIIRDYREDIDDGRSFWPQEVWKKYAPQLGDFRTDRTAGRHCVSELLLLSLRHVTDCLEYLCNVKEPSLFRFCAIPQVMSIATLELIFNNEAIFERNVKITKGLACRLILASAQMDEVWQIFRDFTTRIHARNLPSDPHYFAIEQQCARILRYINDHDAKGEAAQRRKEVMTAEPKRSILGVLALTDDEIEGAKIMAFCAGMCILVMLIMMAIATMFGAQYPNPLRILRGEVSLPNRVER